MGWYRTNAGRAVYWTGTRNPQSWLAYYLLRFAAWIDNFRQKWLSTQNEIRWRQFAVRVDDDGNILIKDIGDPTETWNAVWRMF